MQILVIFAALIYLVLHCRPWAKETPWQEKVATVLAVVGILVWFVVQVIGSGSLHIPSWLTS